jgi:prepilin peptidase CpaA
MLFSITFTGFLIVACITDLRGFRIPNGVPLALMALFLIKAAATGIAVWPDHIVALVLMFALGFVAFGFGMIGGGDAKLMTALALWLGLRDMPGLLSITAIGGGILALVLLTLRYVLDRDPAPATPRGAPGAPRLFQRRAPIPYALPIAAAAIWLEWT